MRIGITLFIMVMGLNSASAAQRLDEAIDTIVIIYEENRGFDHLFGTFPGVNGISNATAQSKLQLDRNGTPLKLLPPVWGSGQHGKPSFPSDLPNQPFVINKPPVNVSLGAITPSPTHTFYRNQMQINGGSNNMFSAWSDAGGLTQGHYDMSKTHLWKLAQQYTLADNYFQGAFGGSFLNHFWLICACAPEINNFSKLSVSLQEKFNAMRATLDSNGQLLVKPDSPKSALDGVPSFGPSTLTPKDQPAAGRTYAINTIYPPYQPSTVAPVAGGDARFADPEPAHGKPPLTPQTMTNIGDLLSEQGISWSWYAQAWNKALDNPGQVQKQGTDLFQPHHQPFNYFANYAPGTKARQQHLQDFDEHFWPAVESGSLPQVVFIKPAGRYDTHAGYASPTTSDDELNEIVQALQKSPQWEKMLVIVTVDENGGFWDHVAPPKGDYWGPGTRIPAIIVSPFAKRGHVDSTQYDGTSILRLLVRRFGLDENRLPGIRKEMGDFSNALDPALISLP